MENEQDLTHYKPMKSEFEYEPLPIQHSRNEGNLIVISRDAAGDPLYLLGPHYWLAIIALLCLTGLFIFIIASTQDKLSGWKLWLLIVANALFALSYIQVIVSSPGLAKPNPHRIIDPSHPRYCAQCCLIKQDQVRHCLDCNVCILDHDHHCPWIGKCVGRQNLNKFYCFILSLGVLFVLFFILLILASYNQDKPSKAT